MKENVSGCFFLNTVYIIINNQNTYGTVTTDSMLSKS